MYAALYVARDAVSLSLCHGRAPRPGISHCTLDRTKNCYMWAIELRNLVTWSNLGLGSHNSDATTHHTFQIYMYLE